MNKQIITEQETLEWLCLVGELKLIELEKTADFEKMALLQQHKSNIMKLLIKNCNKKVTFFFILLLTKSDFYCTI